jgi:hypothetical protein
MPCAPIHFDEIVRRISYANSELIFRNNREKAIEMLKTITSDFCIESSSEDKVTVKAIHKHSRKTIVVDIQVEKSRINDRWLVTMTPYL